MNNCLTLFGITTILMLLSNWLSEYFNNRGFKKEVKHPFIESLNGAVFIISAITFGVTLVFAIYIFIFQYTPSLYFS